MFLFYSEIEKTVSYGVGKSSVDLIYQEIQEENLRIREELQHIMIQEKLQRDKESHLYL